MHTSAPRRWPRHAEERFPVAKCTLVPRVARAAQRRAVPRVSRTAFTLVRSLRFARRMAVASIGAATLENPDGSPRLVRLAPAASEYVPHPEVQVCAGQTRRRTGRRGVTGLLAPAKATAAATSVTIAAGSTVHTGSTIAGGGAESAGHRLVRRLRDSNPGGPVRPNRISSARKECPPTSASILDLGVRTWAHPCGHPRTATTTATGPPPLRCARRVRTADGRCSRAVRIHDRPWPSCRSLEHTCVFRTDR